MLDIQIKKQSSNNLSESKHRQDAIYAGLVKDIQQIRNKVMVKIFIFNLSFCRGKKPFLLWLKSKKEESGTELIC